MTRITLEIRNDEDKALVLALARRLDLVVEEAGSVDDSFWTIINAISFSDDEVDLSPAIEMLAEKSRLEIEDFHRELSKKLFALDQQIYAEHLGGEQAWKEGRAFSSDYFLYARAYAVAKGKVFYESVLKDPKNMPKEDTLEDLLYLAEEAWALKSEEPFEFSPEDSYETFSNAAGWEKTLTDRLLNV